MKKHHHHEITRRKFVRQSACASLGLTGLVDSLAHFTLMDAAMAQVANTSPYQALVVIFLLGGNDANNMLIPERDIDVFDSNGVSAYTNYLGARTVNSNKVLCFVDPRDSSDPTKRSLPLNNTTTNTPDYKYGVHPKMPGVQSLYNNRQLAFVANVGTLCVPLASTADYQSTSILLPKPPQLFSHADQYIQWQSSVSTQPFTNGWGGRIADLMLAGTGYNPSVSMCISMAGVNKLQVGNATQQYCISPTDGVTQMSTGGGGNDPARRQVIDNLSKLVYSHLMERSYINVAQAAKNSGDTIDNVLSTLTSTQNSLLTSCFDTTTYPDGLMVQLQMVAKMMLGRSQLLGSNAAQRQIFFCAVSGYDTHQNQAGNHANLMDELSASLLAFNTFLNDASNKVGNTPLSNFVTTLTSSDFTRTLTPNGDNTDTAGTDHGWGGHQIVMGGSVAGGKIYGQYPDFRLNGGRDTNTTNGRGRWVPSTSVDQYLALMARWFGVQGSTTYLTDTNPNSNSMNMILPNLRAFDNPFDSSTANLSGLLPASPIII